MLEGVLSGITTAPYGIAHCCAPGLQHSHGLELLFTQDFTKLCSLNLCNIFIFQWLIIWTGDSATATVIFSLLSRLSSLIPLSLSTTSSETISKCCYDNLSPPSFSPHNSKSKMLLSLTPSLQFIIYLYHAGSFIPPQFPRCQEHKGNVPKECKEQKGDGRRDYS